MVEQGKGVVEVIRSNDAGYYNVKVGGEWYGAGKSRPRFNDGDYVSFTFTRRGRFMNLDPESVQVQEGTAEAAPNIRRVAGAAQGTSAGGNRNDYWEKKAEKDENVQASINWQAARNSAIAACNSMVEHGIVSLPAAKAKKFDVFMALVDDVTTRYFNDTQYVFDNKEPPMSEGGGMHTDADEEDAPF